MKLKIKNRIFAIFFLASSILAGCGGGSDLPAAPVVATLATTATATVTAEGVYVGDLTGSRSNEFEMLVLENGEFWSVYGTSTSSAFGIAGFVQGSGTSNKGIFTSANGKDFGVNPALAGNVSATYDATAKTIAGTITATTGTVAFSGGPIVGSLYIYNTPASLTTVAGAWSTTSLTGENVALNITSDGAFTATSSSGCKFLGVVTPRSSGKNVFNVAMTFGAAPCALSGQGGSGIALAYPLANGKTQLIVAATDSTRTYGFGLASVSSITSTSTGSTPIIGLVSTGTSTPTMVTTSPATVPLSTGTYTSSKTCYTGPRGGTYTITASGGKNYSGC